MSAAIQGIDGYPLTVEVDFRFGLPSFTIVGLPDTSVREARERVLTAVKNSGFTFPAQRITVNLAPGDIKKEGPSFDFAMAIGILGAAEILELPSFSDLAFLGELGLNGHLRPVKGVLPCALGLKESGVKGLLLPKSNAREAALVEGLNIFPVESLLEAFDFLTGKKLISSFSINRSSIFSNSKSHSVDFSDVKGQNFAKRAFEIAASGSHNLVLLGPPGSGKTLLARRLPTILPDMSFDEALETTKIHSISGALKNTESLIATRPFRSPHHGISNAALVGGGTNPRPGEVSLAHRGVLFLDEFPEFGRNVLESLRQPLEDCFVTVVRVANAVKFPSDFMLVAAANPCPCGYLGSGVRSCTCTPMAIQKYRAKMSGPLMDRIDIHVEVPSLKIDEITEESMASESSGEIKLRVIAARDLQRERFRDEGIYDNGQMNVNQIKKFCVLDTNGKDLLKRAIKKLGLSARAYDRLLRLSRTIADLDGKDSIETVHIAEAISYRVLDRAQSAELINS